MKILYLLESPIDEESGILNKVKGQIRYWEEFGCETLTISLNYNEDKHQIDFQFPYFISNYSLLKIIPFKFLRNYINKALSANNVKKKIIQFQPDIIYYRQGIWFPGLFKILNLPIPVIMEINTYDLLEIKKESLLRQLIYKFGRNKILKKVDGLVCVTYEIKNFYRKLNIPMDVISNGYDFDSIDIKSLQKDSLDKKQINIVFVGSPGYDWHGVDKILYLASELVDYTFHIVGEERLKNTLTNVIYHGFLKKQELIKLYYKMDIAIGTLSLYKKGLNEASPLKVREYAVFGIPIILGYKDTDLNKEEGILNIGNYENNVKDNVLAINDFILEWNNRKIDRKKMQIKLSSKFKEQKRLHFFHNFKTISN